MTPVVYNGATNTFSGNGTPNPKLTIPQKDKMDPATLAMALAIEQWCNNVVAPAGGGLYASLTGPGETVTPGELDQAGPLLVIDTTSAGSIQLFELGSGGIVLFTTAQVFIQGPSIVLDSNATPLMLEGIGIQFISQTGGSSGPTVTLFTNAGNPNGAVTSVAKGDLCTDNVTPGLWIATAAASTVWTAL